MNSNMLIMQIIYFFLLTFTVVNSFRNYNNNKFNQQHQSRTLVLNAMKKNDKPKSYASPEIADVGYPPFGSLIRQGPGI